MPDSEDPERLTAGKDSFVKSLLEEGKKELASPSQLAAVAAKLGPILGGGGGPGGGSPGAARPGSVGAPKAAGLGLTKTLGIAALGVATLATVFHVVTTPQTAAIPLNVTPEGPVPGDPAAPGPATPDPLAPLMAMSLPTATSTPPASHHVDGPPAASVKHDPNAPAELKLLTAAMDALPADPTRALELCTEAARRYPTGAFVPERETLAIQSLVALGRTAEARKRADAFHAAFPDSPHGRRIDELLTSP